MSQEGDKTQGTDPIVNISSGVVSSNDVRPKSKRPIILIVVIIIIIGLVVGILIYNANKKPTSKIVTDVCTSKNLGLTYSQIVGDFKTNNISEQYNLAKTINKQANYVNDPNCTYILTVYYTNIFNTKSANTSLSEFKKANATNKVSQNLAVYVPVNQLSQFVNNVNKQAQTNISNVKALSPDPGPTPKAQGPPKT
jgi:hypothetical protein